MLIETRRAADLVGATPMDRPEDVQPNPVNGRVYVMLTNNTRRKQEQVDAVNPRANNAHGQVVELVPPGGEGEDADHAADEFGWNMLLLGGDPETADVGAKYHAQTQAWLSSPDNCAFDPQGRLWISTDQGGAQAKNAIPDGMFACDLAGDGRALAQVLLRLPGRGGDVRAGVHPGRQDAVRGRAAPGRGGRLRLDLREADDPLAGLPGGRAAAAVDRGHHQGRRRADRELGSAGGRPAGQPHQTGQLNRRCTVNQLGVGRSVLHFSPVGNTPPPSAGCLTHRNSLALGTASLEARREHCARRRR